MLVDPSDLEPKDLYRLMITCVVPRPIAWVSTMAPDGTLNAAPFSYFQALSSNPPSIMISVGRKRGGEAKDTRRNIEETKEFVVNVVSESSGEAMVRSSVAYDYGVSEFEEVGLEPAPSAKVKPPRIAESAVSLECRLDRVFEIGNSGICIGEVVAFHLRDDVLAADGTVDPRKLRPLGRLGGSTYAPVTDVTSITVDDGASAVDSEMLSFFEEVRARSVDMARVMTPDHLVRQLEGGVTVSRILCLIMTRTGWACSILDGEEIDQWPDEDASSTAAQLADELEADGALFTEKIRPHLATRRAMLRGLIRMEAMWQGQIVATLPPEEGVYGPWEAAFL